VGDVKLWKNPVLLLKSGLVAGLLVVVGMAFRVSWNALRDIALAIGADPTAAKLYAFVVDGLMVVALVAALFLTDRARTFALSVLGSYTVASLALNYVHGLVPALHEPTGQGPVRLAEEEWLHYVLVGIASALPVGSIFFGSHLVAIVLHHQPGTPSTAKDAVSAEARPVGYAPYSVPDSVHALGAANGYPVPAEAARRVHPVPAAPLVEEPHARPVAEPVSVPVDVGAEPAPYGPEGAAEAATDVTEGARVAVPEHPFDFIAQRAAEERVHAASQGRTRVEVHAEYTPEPGPDPVSADDFEAPAEDAASDGGRVHPAPDVPDVPADAGTPPGPVSGDELTARVRADFADELAAGRIPGVRPLRAAYGIGQPRAQRIRDELKGGRS
jgi:hypothetical protein